MNLIYLANQRLPTEKAYGIQIVKMCETFSVRGMDVELVIPTRKNPIDKTIFEYYGVRNNFKVKKIFSPDFYFPGKLDKIAFLIKNFLSAFILSAYVLLKTPDIIFSRDEFLIYILSFFKKNLIFEAHKFSPRRAGLYRRFNKAGIKIITISRGLKDEFVKFGFDSDSILVAHDGVDLEEFVINIDKIEARKRVGLPANKKIVLYSGQLFEWKGADILAEVAALVEDTLFVFVGGLGGDLVRFKKKFGTRANVLILGQKPHREIPYFLKAADVLVLPNKKDGGASEFYTSPLKLFEYMASQKPIVASDLPALREILNENNSFLVNPDDVSCFANGVVKVLSDNVLADGISKKAFEDVGKYAWEKRAERIINFIQ